MLGQESPVALPGQAALNRIFPAGAPREGRPARSVTKVILLPLAVLALVSGCAGVQEVTGTASQQDLMQLRADMTALQLAVQRLRTDTERQATETRARDQARDGQRASADELTRRLDTLSTSLATLTARVDQLATRVEGMGPRVGAAPSVNPPRAPATPPPSPLAARPPASPPTTARPATGGVQAQDLYQAAYIDFSKGSYPLAIAGFREFLRRYPDDELAGSAQYWIGEAHFSIARGHVNGGKADQATPELERAVQEFRKVVANYPRSDKAPAALYKEALALIDLKQPRLAQQRLQYLIDNFPQAEETPLARERMSALRGG